jgi:dihydrodipicolinate synthase/N-acetylneuraminate lyase
LELLRELRRGPGEFVRILGNDNALVEARRENLLDGLISGVAGVAPELILAVWEQREGAADLLQELLEKLSGVPTPWGLKWIAEARGWFAPDFALPLSEARQREARMFRVWCEGWLERIQNHAGSRR